jgi:hypothetical protein
MELPRGRAIAWNVAFIAAETIGAVVAHIAFGVAWWQLGAGLAAVLLLGVALLVYVVTIATPRANRRHKAQLRAHVSTRQFPAGDPSSAGQSTNTSHTGRAA